MRLSVTDRCDFRCVYCMSEDMTVPAARAGADPGGAVRASAARSPALGVRKIRLTGGEPLVRNNIMWLVEQLGALPGLDELMLTTNGSQLPRLARRACAMRA